MRVVKRWSVCRQLSLAECFIDQLITGWLGYGSKTGTRGVVD